MSLTITNECNMELMKRYPDNYFDLAIVDPPYGIGWNNMQNEKHGEGKIRNGWKVKFPDYKKADWDNEKPSQEYFDELFRVSKNQIIWGANHFELPPTKCMIFWDKLTGDFSFGDGELAWCSIGGSIKKYVFRWHGMLKGPNGNYREKRVHPTQKPVALYEWLVKTYAKEGDKILDTHLGSGSIAIAVDNANKIEKMNLTLIACELDKDHYNNTISRIKQQTNWQSLF